MRHKYCYDLKIIFTSLNYEKSAMQILLREIMDIF